MKRLMCLATFLLCAPLAAQPFFYLGVEGGWITGVSRSTPKAGVGAFGLQGDAINPEPRAGFQVGGNIGYRFSCWTRSEVAYNFHRQSYDWQALFPSGAPAAFPPSQVQLFEAKLNSHLIFWNQYLHPRDFCPSLSHSSNFDPYLVGGVGAAFNRLDDIKESAAGSFFTSTVTPKTVSQLGFRFGIGSLFYSSHSWMLDAGIHVTYIGEARSAMTRTVASGTVQTIGPYVFENNWIGVFNVGLKFGGRP